MKFLNDKKGRNLGRNKEALVNRRFKTLAKNC